MKLINIRGTSGSGKTWVMRQIMAKLGPWKPHFIPRRRKPLYYTNKKGMVILGNYDNPSCGGCDNVAKEPIKEFIGADGVNAAYKIIREVLNKYKVVFFEGLLISEDVKHALTVKNLHVIFLTTTVEDCCKGVEKRRSAKGNVVSLHEEKPLGKTGKKKPTAAKRIYLRSRTIERARLKLLDQGIHCVRASSNQAVKLALKWCNNAK